MDDFILLRLAGALCFAPETLLPSSSMQVFRVLSGEIVIEESIYGHGF
jgi:hypothetical protein